ncbi:FAD-dependent oxidoreductase [Actinoplanes sp. M2I2]|uniref:FAD-dependent oxidoreductase n=1 Tax=Actinoplanes sp. M2I2 TaxID=1734444 RepID=UPI0020202DD8|nr:FAD-dependent oxidoreductase [Actinoplanes sp. M2I2]
MKQPEADIIVIGAGVSGLTTAICLAEAGAGVTVWTAEPTTETTSMAAGAMWGPYLVQPLDRVDAWSTHTLAVLRDLANDVRTGVRLVSGIEASRGAVEAPAWGGQLDGFRMCEPHELPANFSTEWRYTAPLVEMPIYLEYLRRRLTGSGGVIQRRRVSALAEATREVGIVVNCAGMGARDLVDDRKIVPVRGQLVVMKNPGLHEFFSEDTGASPDLTHWYPYGDTVVLGGTAQPDVWNRGPDPAVAMAIIRRCAEIEPRFDDAEVLAHRVGLRPTRDPVRVEEESTTGARIIHNYGHGGAGVTLSWGCAADVAELALVPRSQRAQRPPRRRGARP